MNLKQFLETYSQFDPVSDSRKADVNSMFFAIRGSSTDSHKFLPQVYKQGCRNFVIEESGLNLISDFKNINYLVVPNSKQAWAYTWKSRSHNPDKDMFIVGVTGTNGKTSITMMIEHILNSSDVPCGVMGTIDHHLNTSDQIKVWPTNLTTPGSEILYPRIQEMKQLGAKAVALEISSHALDQKRAEGLNLNVAVFSNFTEDHLDYHKTYEHYFESKLRLFEELLKESDKRHKSSILNYNDDWIKRYTPNFGNVEVLLEVQSFENLQNQDQFKTLAQQKKSNKNLKINLLKIKTHDLNGLKFELLLNYDPSFSMSEFINSSEGSNLHQYNSVISFELPVMGHFQALNWTQAALACRSAGISNHQLTDSAKSFLGVPGRLQKVLSSKQKAVFVDYAHTPDALERSILSLKNVCEGKLIVVFGCGGDRDKSKRPVMGTVAETLADIQIITNDNPRTEDPEVILKDILSGFKKLSAQDQQQILNDHSISNGSVIVELNRKSAIKKGLELLTSPKDILLIAGKGHENYQILKDQTIEFSDYQTVQELC